jgi:phage-related protein
VVEGAAFTRGSETHRRGHQNGRVWLASWDARFRPLGDGVYEVRTNLVQNRIARVLFYIDKKGRMVLLHGFIKKTPKTPDEDLELARSNKKKHQRGLR